MSGCLFHELIGVANGNCQIGTAKIIQDGEVHTDHLALTIEEWSPGSARSSRRIIDKLVLQNISDVSLGGRGANKASRCELGNNLSDLVGVFRHFFCSFVSRSGEDSFDSRRIANQYNRIARYTGFTALIELKQRGMRRYPSL